MKRLLRRAPSILYDANPVFLRYISTSSSTSSSQSLPVITVIGATYVQHYAGNVYTDLGATATDSSGTDISNSIVENNPVDQNTGIGQYTVTYNVTDSDGNAAIQSKRTVQVIPQGQSADVVAPVITLVGSASVTITQGTTYNDAGATATDNVDGTLTNSIVTVNPVNSSTPGTYTVTYNVSDAAGNAATQVTRQVIVNSSSVRYTIDVYYQVHSARTIGTDWFAAWASEANVKATASGSTIPITITYSSDIGTVGSELAKHYRNPPPSDDRLDDDVVFGETQGTIGIAMTQNDGWVVRQTQTDLTTLGYRLFTATTDNALTSAPERLIIAWYAPEFTPGIRVEVSPLGGTPQVVYTDTQNGGTGTSGTNTVTYDIS